MLSEGKGGGVSNPGIIPMAVGAGVLIAVIIGVFIYFKRKKRRGLRGHSVPMPMFQRSSTHS